MNVCNAMCLNAGKGAGSEACTRAKHNSPSIHQSVIFTRHSDGSGALHKAPCTLRTVWRFSIHSSTHRDRETPEFGGRYICSLLAPPGWIDSLSCAAMKCRVLLVCLAFGLAAASLSPDASELKQLKQSCKEQLDSADGGEYGC